MAGVRLDSIPEESAPVRLSDIPDSDAAVASNLSRIDQQRQAESFEEPSTFAYLFNRLKKGFAGFMGSPGDVVDLARQVNVPTAVPLNLINRLLPSREEVPTKSVIATSDLYRDALGVDPNMKTGSDLKRYAGGVVEMAGAGGPFALAATPATLLPLATGVVGSGIGMEAGGDVASGLGLSRELGEAGGALVGGVASAVVPNAGMGLVGAVKRRFSPSANKAAAESQVSREIAGQLESYPAAQQNIERSLQISDDIPGFTPSLPARSGAPGLLAEEKRLVSANPETLNKAVRNKEESAQAIADFVNSKFPAAGGETAVQRVNKLAKVKLDRLEGMKVAIDEKLDDALRVFETNPANAENGNRLRDLFFKQKEVYSGIRSQKYQEVYEAADRLGVRAKIDDAVQYADDVLKSELNGYQQSEIPPVFRQLAKQEAGEVSFAQLHSLYKRTNSDLASLRGSTAADKDFKIHLLEGLKSKLTEKLAGFEADGFGEVATKLKEANRFYAQEYLPRFKQGFGGDIAAKYGTGEFRTPDQAVTELITKRPNNTQAARDFKLIYGESEEAWGALRAGYMDELYRNSGLVSKDGRINQKALDTFLRKHEPTLGEFPQIKSELQALAADNAGLLARRAQIVAAEKKIAAKDLFKLFQGRDPDVILTEAAQNPNAMRVLAYQARNDKGMAQGLARGIAEHVTKQQDPMAFLKANEEAIRLGLKPLGEDHFKNLQTAVEAMTINSRSQIPTSVNPASVSADALGAKLGSSPRALVSAYLSVQRGRTGAEQEAAAILGRKFDQMRREHKVVAMEAAFYDKDVARALANLAKNPASDKAKLDFQTQMMALGVRTEVAGQE